MVVIGDDLRTVTGKAFSLSELRPPVVYPRDLIMTAAGGLTTTAPFQPLAWNAQTTYAPRPLSHSTAVVVAPSSQPRLLNDAVACTDTRKARAKLAADFLSYYTKASELLAPALPVIELLANNCFDNSRAWIQHNAPVSTSESGAGRGGALSTGPHDLHSKTPVLAWCEYLDSALAEWAAITASAQQVTDAFNGPKSSSEGRQILLRLEEGAALDLFAALQAAVEQGADIRSVFRVRLRDIIYQRTLLTRRYAFRAHGRPSTERWVHSFRLMTGISPPSVATNKTSGTATTIDGGHCASNYRHPPPRNCGRLFFGRVAERDCQKHSPHCSSSYGHAIHPGLGCYSRWRHEAQRPPHRSGRREVGNQFHHVQLRPGRFAIGDSA
jgi:hypothetical protein